MTKPPSSDNIAVCESVDPSYVSRDIAFDKYKKLHPSISFAQFRGQKIAAGLQAGKAHFSLGSNLRDASGKQQDFWTAGAAVAERYFKEMRLKPHHRVIDYGCGSLRVGAHFIRFLNPGCYFGVDVVPDFFNIGRALIGEELLSEKRPLLRVINPSTIAEAADFHADFVFSAAVCIHVHPDELTEYFEQLMRLTACPGAQLHINAALSDAPIRFRYESWAWPLKRYRTGLPELRLIQSPPGHEILKPLLLSLGIGGFKRHGAHRVWKSHLVFRRR
ncbi:MAG: SAM-dependent methyltransferase [Rhizomicrobium sp.]|jgi:SAM-dependent methyltransferase